MGAPRNFTPELSKRSTSAGKGSSLARFGHQISFFLTFKCRPLAGPSFSKSWNTANTSATLPMMAPSSRYQTHRSRLGNPLESSTQEDAERERRVEGHLAGHHTCSTGGKCRRTNALVRSSSTQPTDTGRGVSHTPEPTSPCDQPS